MSDVFISYKAEDRRRVKPLVEALQSEELSVWWDEHIGAGDAWRETIEHQLDDARCVIVIWSKRSVGPDGKFVRDEASRAQRRSTYVPVLIDPVEPPLGFGESQATSLRGWHGDRSDPHYQALLSAVRRQVGGEIGAIIHPVRRSHVDRRAVLAGGAVGAIALASLGGWVLLKPSSASTSGSIAVLPFDNLSGDPSQAYFSDGLAEELRSALSRVPQLAVVARTSSEAVRNDDAKTAARKLGVANILTGSVRRSPSLIRVSAQLVDGITGLERWSQDFDRPFGDVLAVQTNIAENVVSALRIQLVGATKAALMLGGTRDAAAQDLYLQAEPDRQNGSPEDLQRAVTQLDAAIQIDPNYAQAYARKAATLSSYGGTYAHSNAEGDSFLDQATAAAKRAIELAPKLPESHAALADIYRNQLRLKDADREMRTAVSLPGADATTWVNYGVFLTQGGIATEALSAVSRAMQLDPLNPAVFAGKASALFDLHQFTPAIAAAQEALKINPSLAFARRLLGYSLIMMHRYDEAADQFSKLPEDSLQAQTARAVIAASKGNLKASDQLIAQMQQTSGDTANYQYAQVYAQRKDADATIRYLDKALTARDPGLAFVRADPFFDPIRSDPRFAEIVRRLDFPA